MYSIKIAIRSLFYRKSQYMSLFLVCMFGLAISICAICISNGMIKTLNQKAKIYYGGDFTLMCSYGDGLEIFDYEEKLQKIKELLPDDAQVYARIDFAARRNSSFYFEGTQALQQTIKGVDFDKEKDLLSSFNIVEGSLEGLSGSNSIIISLPIARLLNVQVGDEITLQLKTLTSYINTVDVKVGAIFQDSSAFGMYTSYIDFDYLHDAREYPEHYANRICVNFPKRNISQKELYSIYLKLAQEFNFVPYLDDKDDFTDNQYKFPSETWGFVPLSANLTDIQIMQKAMDAVITFIIVMLTVIIIAGIGSTYRVLIMKRINEIGIYMALGMKKRSILFTLLFESFVLLVLGCAAGLIFSGIFNWILSLFNFSFIPSFDMFLEKGNLVPRLDVFKSVIVVISVIITTMFAVFYSTLTSIKIMPVDALATTE